MPHEIQRVPPLAQVILAPAIAVAIAMCAVEGYRAARPEAALFALPPVASLADAILHGSVEQAYSFIRNGQDPNATITVQDPDFAGGPTMAVTPLVVAVESRQDNVVAMLLSAGARLDLPGNVAAICLAEERDDAEMREVLRPKPGASSIQCPEHVLGP